MHVKNVTARRIIINLIVTLLVSVALVVIVQTKDAPVRPIEVEDYNDGWSVYSEDDDHTVLYERIIDADLPGEAIGFRSVDSFIDVLVNGENIYHFGQSTWYLESPGTLYNIVTIPENSEGKTLTVLVSRAYRDSVVEEYDFSKGNYYAIELDLLSQNLLDNIANVILIVVGLFLVALFFIGKRKNHIDKSSVYLGLITIYFILWSIMDIYTGQLLFPSGQFRYLAYYYTLYTLPIYIFLYLETLSDKYVPKLVLHTHIIIAILFTVLHLTGVMEFTQSLRWYCVLTCIELIHALTNFSYMKEEKNKRLIVAFMVWLATIFINVGVYVINPVEGAPVVIAKIGMLFYIAVSTLTTINRFTDELLLIHKAEILEKQAYTDNLTGLGNRYAFEEKMRSVNIENIAIVSLDINNLKQHNDRFGHLVGDELIRTAADVLSTVYKNVYRTGGDEFIAIIDKCSDEELEKLKSELQELSKARTNERITVQIACGYSKFQQFDKTYEDILRRADANMYIHKNSLKND